MYSQASIDVLIGRVGWAQAVQPTPIIVSGDNLSSASGRTFTSFHKLVTAENVWACRTNASSDSASFNAVLADIRKQAVLKVLSAVFVTSKAAQFTIDARGQQIVRIDQDYDPVISVKAALFDEAIGYQVAIDTIEYLIASPRSNAVERAIDMSVDMLKIELNGYTNEAGTKVEKGLFGMLGWKIGSITAILFPATSVKATIRNATNFW